MSTQVTIKHIGIFIAGILSAVIAGYVTYLITENDELNRENEILKTMQDIVQQATISATTAQIRAEYAQKLVDNARQEVEKINVTIDATKALSSAQNQMEQLRVIAKREAERIVNVYIDNIKSLPVIATIQVEDGKLKNASSGVTYSNGVVTFSNPRNYKFVPIVSDYSGQNYMTEKVYVNGLLSNTSFKVWQTALDTGNRNKAPWSFTAVVIGSTF